LSAQAQVAVGKSGTEDRDPRLTVDQAALADACVFAGFFQVEMNALQRHRSQYMIDRVGGGPVQVGQHRHVALLHRLVHGQQYRGYAAGRMCCCDVSSVQVRRGGAQGQTGG
jgi:hypothetical protein